MLGGQLVVDDDVVDPIPEDVNRSYR